MKIAIIGTTAVPPTFGGMDRFYDGLYEALRDDHDVDLILHPVDERDFRGILQGYVDFYEMDLSKYDVVISTKGPSYMVRHPYHINYLSHRMRVFYDQWKPGGPEAEIQRRIIEELDTWALSKDRIKKQFVIGETVRQRLLNWGSIESEVLYLPTHSGQFTSGGQSHWLVVGRLHEWKRVDLIIKALQHVRSNTKLKIVGTGPQEKELRMLAQDDPRIEFLSYVSDAELAELYGNSIGVVFTPLSEDLGLVTLESFMSGKPVITTTDSGEPAVIVKKHNAGIVVCPDPIELANAMQNLEENLTLADEMGLRGRTFASGLSWKAVENRLLLGVKEELQINNCKSLRILVTDNQILDPPVGGGRLRIFNLYRNFPQDTFQIKYIGAYDWPGPTFRRQLLAPHFEEIVTPLTQVHFKLDSLYSKLTANATTIDVTIPNLIRYSPRFLRLLNEYIRDADVISVCHPWIYPAVKKILNSCTRKPILIYDSQNFEHGLKKQILTNGILKSYLLRQVKRVEMDLVRSADLIFACSQEDVHQFVNHYGVSASKCQVVPNGVMVDEIRPVPQTDIESFKQAHNLIKRHTAVFVGSNYPPNHDAVKYICNYLAPLISDCNFLIIGGAGDAYLNDPRYQVPDNVHILGTVDAETRNMSYCAAEIAINPMSRGSGTNIKMFDFMAARLPIVTTAVGARGIDEIESIAKICTLDLFPQVVKENLDNEEWKARASDLGFQLVNRQYDWRKISLIAAELIEQCVAVRR